MTNNSEHRIWITYAWVDNEKGGFRYLVQELKAVGVEAKYDRIEIIPGRGFKLVINHFPKVHSTFYRQGRK